MIDPVGAREDDPVEGAGVGARAVDVVEVLWRQNPDRRGQNRFGAANEVGVFAMTEQGLKEVKNPSAIFLSHHPQPVPGSAVMIAREGSRPMLIEVQALSVPKDPC